ncbi:MAG: hypothetical protein NTZ03_05660 [Actinobacteria bacterium]|nr:hypothetical protein [Actinomycetota bacterium]
MLAHVRMHEISAAQLGFQAFSMADVDPVEIISISVWGIHDEAAGA